MDETLKILFGINNNAKSDIEDKILKAYKKMNGKSFEYDREYYLQGILKSLEDNKYDILFISETFEADLVSLSLIDMITDKYSDLRIIFIMKELNKDNKIAKGLFSLGCYDGLYTSDFSLSNIVNLIDNPRNKKAAKLYYEIDDNLDVLDEVVHATLLTEIPDDELNIVLDNFNAATSENIKELFELAVSTYNINQMNFLVSILNDRVINLIEEQGCDISKYQKAINKEVKKASKKEKLKFMGNIVSKLMDKPKEKIVEKIVEKEVPVEIEKIVEKEVEVEKIVEKEVPVE